MFFTSPKIPTIAYISESAIKNGHLPRKTAAVERLLHDESMINDTKLDQRLGFVWSEAKTLYTAVWKYWQADEPKKRSYSTYAKEGDLIICGFSPRQDIRRLVELEMEIRESVQTAKGYADVPRKEIFRKKGSHYSVNEKQFEQH